MGNKDSYAQMEENVGCLVNPTLSIFEFCANLTTLTMSSMFASKAFGNVSAAKSYLQ